MKKVKSCGVLLFKSSPNLAFLLMRHPYRYDLPKGHIHAGETESACALREMEEETGIPSASVRLDPNFRFTTTYFPRESGGMVVEKTLIIFIGWLNPQEETSTIIPTEHSGFEWVDWNPPHQFNNLSVDPLLAQAQAFFERQGGPRQGWSTAAP